jgi:hypothetical protein
MRFTLTPCVRAKPFTSRTLEQTIDPKSYQGGSQAGYGSQKNQRPDSDIYHGSKIFRKKQITSFFGENCWFLKAFEMTDGSLILIFFQRIETRDSLILKYVFKTGTGGSLHIFKELHNTGMFPQLNGTWVLLGGGVGSVSPDLSAQ